jgi:hypothetical protein
LVLEPSSGSVQARLSQVKGSRIGLDASSGRKSVHGHRQEGGTHGHHEHHADQGCDDHGTPSAA